MSVNVVPRGPVAPGAPPVEATWRAALEPGALILPDGAWDLVADPALGTVRVVGVMTRPRVSARATSTPLIGFRFRPGLGRRFTGVAAHALRDRVVDLRDVAPALAERIAREGLTFAGMQRAVAAHWMRCPSDPAVDCRVEHALALLQARHGEWPPVAQVAQAVGLSRRQLERLFLEHVGTPPKHYQRVARLHSALAAMRRRRGLAEAACEAGYADQAHLTREMRELTGRTPSALLRHL